MDSFLKALNLIDGTSRSWIKAAPIKDDQSAPNHRLNKQKQTLRNEGNLQIKLHSYAPSDDGQFLKALNLIDGTLRSWIKAAWIKYG